MAKEDKKQNGNINNSTFPPIKPVELLEISSK